MNFTNHKSFVQTTISICLQTNSDIEFPGVFRYGVVFMNDVVTTTISANNVDEVISKAEHFLNTLTLYVTKETPESKKALAEFVNMVEEVKNRRGGVLGNFNKSSAYISIKVNTIEFSTPVTVIEV